MPDVMTREHRSLSSHITCQIYVLCQISNTTEDYGSQNTITLALPREEIHFAVNATGHGNGNVKAEIIKRKLMLKADDYDHIFSPRTKKYTAKCRG